MNEIKYKTHRIGLGWRRWVLVRWLRIKVWYNAAWLTRHPNPRRWHARFQAVREMEAHLSRRVDQSFLFGQDA